MKDALFVCLLLVTLLYFIDCSTSRSKTCTQNNEIEDVLKNCTVSAINITDYLDKCFQDFGHCLTNLECLESRECLESQKCEKPKNKPVKIVNTNQIMERIHILFDICEVNATKLSEQMNACINSMICLTDQQMEKFYQNLSHHMCNISNGFMDVAVEILKYGFIPQDPKVYKTESKERDTKCIMEKENALNEANSEENKKNEDCRINATDLCGKVEQCMEKNHGVLPSLNECDINATQLAAASVQCMEKKKCLTQHQKELWILNNSAHLYHIAHGFKHSADAFWNISEGYSSTLQEKESKKEGHCQIKQIPIYNNTKKSTNAPEFDKNEYYKDEDKKSVQEQELVNAAYR